MAVSDATRSNQGGGVVPASADLPPVDKISKEVTARRKQRAVKRKLSELYFVTKSPYIPISDQKILESQGELFNFLSKNDLEAGYTFDASSLPQSVSRTPSTSAPVRNNNTPQRQVNARTQPVQMASRKTSSTSISVSPVAQKVSPPLQQSTSPQKSSVPSSSPQAQSVQLQNTEGPPRKLQRTESPIEVKEETPMESSSQLEAKIESDTENREQQHREPPNNISRVPGESQRDSEPPFPVPPISADYKPLPTLSSLIKAYADSTPSKLTEREKLAKKRELDISDIDINKLSVSLIPGNLPSQIPESSPLAELYYLTQTCPLSKLIPTTNKTMTTETYESALLEGKLAVVYSRIEELKRQKKWSLRQPQRFHEPFIQYSSHKSQWSNLLDEGKWMATDFKEGRKFKLVQCMFISQAVTDYWNYGKVMCVKRKPIKYLGEEDPMDVDKSESRDDKSTEISASIEENSEGDKADKNTEEKEKDEEEEETGQKDNVAEEDGVKREEEEEVLEEVVEAKADGEVPEEDAEDENDTIDISLLLKRPDPASEISIPKLPEFTKDEIPKVSQPFKMYIDKEELSALNLNIVESLPTYEPFDDDHEHKELPIVPVSKLLVPKDEEEGDWYKVIAKENYFIRGSSYATERGLFGFSSTKRLTFIRPPIPPPLKYLDLRIPTIWLPEDDRHLIRYVAEYQFNWNIISAHLSAKATKGFFSNSERRTPWQCFERYIQLNDKFQFSDMRGGYTLQAQMWLEAAHKAQTTTKRRISPLGVGNDSIQRGHKRLRWASMFEAMRKSMKKRETAPKLSNSTLKKEDKKVTAPTPADLAKLKYERDKAIQEAYAHQSSNVGVVKTSASAQNLPLQAQQQSRSNSTNSQVQAIQRQLAAAAAVANGANGVGKVDVSGSPDLIAHQQLAQAQRMQRANSGSLVGGTPRAGSPNGVSRAGSQNDKPSMQAANAALQAQQQRLQLQQAQAAAAKMNGRSDSNPLGSMTGANGQQYTNEQLQQMIALQRQRQQQAQQQAALKAGSVSAQNSNSGTPVMGNASLSGDASKRMSPAAQGTPGATQQPAGSLRIPSSFTNSQVTAIVQQIQAQHPHLNKQQVSRLAATYLHNLSSQQQQRAMAAQKNGINNSNPSTPVASQPGSSKVNTPQQGARNLTSSLQMLNSAQLIKLANSPTLTANQRQQILSLQQQRLRSAGQAVMGNNRQNSNQPLENGSPVGETPTPQQLASQRAKLQEQQGNDN